MWKMNEENFLKDVANHELTIKLNDGLNRHITLRKPGTNNQMFHIVTWPGYLSYSGDMGCFVFSRLPDMFEFFRDRGHGPLDINLSYWAEKLEAVDREGRHSSEREFDEERFTEHVNEIFDEWVEGDELNEEDKQKLREALDDDVLRHGEDGEFRAHEVLGEFELELNGHTYRFQDTWEWDLTKYTIRFIWCCYALAWAIRQYDKANQTVEVANAAV